MAAIRKNFKEDILELVASDEGISRRQLRIKMKCGENQLKNMVDLLVADKEIHIYYMIDGMHLYTYQYAKAQMIPSKEKRKTPVWGANKARLEGKVVLSDSEKSDIATRPSQILFDSLMVPSRSAT